MDLLINQPTVDVVIPVYNGAPYIEDAVQSVANQTYPLANIWVVNDGSTDNTEEILKDLAARDSRIKIVSKKNGGLSSARNAGILKSTSQLVAFLDADDVWHPTKIEKQVEVFRNTSVNSLGLVFCGYELMDTNGRPVTHLGVPKLHQIRGDVRKILMAGNFISSSGSGVLIRRECFDAVGMFDEGLASCEDWDMWIRISRRYCVDFSLETLVKIRRHNSNMQKNSARMALTYLKVLSKYVNDPELKPLVVKSAYLSFNEYCAPRYILQLLRDAKRDDALNSLVKEIRSRLSFRLTIFIRLFRNSHFLFKLRKLPENLRGALRPKRWAVFDPDAPLVTVIVPTHDAELYIEHTIRSLLSQTLVNFEVLVIDNSNADKTGTLVKQFCDSRLRYFRINAPVSRGAVLNFGVNQAKGKYIAVLEAGDLAKKTRLERQARVLCSRDEVSLVSSMAEAISYSGERRGNLDWRFSPEAYFVALNFRSCISLSSIMFKKDVFHKLGGFTEEVEGKVELALAAKISLESKIIQVPEVLVSLRGGSADAIGNEARKGFSDASSVSTLSEADVEEFSMALPAAYQAIIDKMPNFYDRSRTERYIEEDLALYFLALQAVGRQLELPESLRPSRVSWIKGALHFMARCQGARWPYFFVSKDHF